ncbi:MAG: acyltransferase [Clostridia bacterium]|nr:acyltransferase [Clostridia bacterium]
MSEMRVSCVDGTEILKRYRGAVMGAAALWILLLHCWVIVIPNRPVLGAIESAVKVNGIIGVEMFLFYSGMGLTYAIRRCSLQAFYVQRIRRVLFPFWIMAILRAITEKWDWIKLLRIASGTAFLTESIHLLLWYVPALLVLYLFYPLYHRLIVCARSKAMFTLGALGIWLLLSVIFRDRMREDVWCMTNRIPSFLLGIYIGEASHKRSVKMDWKDWALCCGSIAAGCILRDAANKGMITLLPQAYYAATTLIGVPLCFLFSLVFSVLEAYGKRLGKLVIRFFSFVGTFTLELYCIHQWLFELMFRRLEGKLSYLTINMVLLPVLVLSGWLFQRIHAFFWRTWDYAAEKGRAHQ